ncbi:ABC transporter permease subunit [Lichenifustis flavocetrariae]|uniref:ABC transporter permease subunit n=1 Tax=Lichenifustis flavocetrariae TaxID=2949735 RepID=A0AA42CQU8_9HYPH|nr:ABC transporter permease subunit [Lichenifustis flavocetrariae]MCW6511807.1 ABC transporter permease subunit [Lichenifustis flavocetrariae]
METLVLAASWSGQLAAGLGVTLALAALSIVLGTAVGLGCALLAARPGVFGPRLVLMAAGLVRSLPELLVIFAAYYGFAFLLQAIVAPFGVTGFVAIDAFWAGVMALTLIHAAFCTEVFRGAFAALPPGPIEAARALGLRRVPVFWLVAWPLALRYALPGWMNLTIVSLKLTPLVAAVGLQDLLRTAGDAGRNTHDYLLFYLLALGIYLALAAAIGLIQMRLEARLTRVWAG